MVGEERREGFRYVHCCFGSKEPTKETVVKAKGREEGREERRRDEKL